MADQDRLTARPYCDPEILREIAKGYRERLAAADNQIDHLIAANVKLTAERDEAIKQRDVIADAPMNEWGVRVWEIPGHFGLFGYEFEAGRVISISGCVALQEILQSRMYGAQDEQAIIQQIAVRAGRQLAMEIARKIAPDLYRLSRQHIQIAPAGAKP